jgi:hypothetical protein
MAIPQHLVRQYDNPPPVYRSSPTTHEFYLGWLFSISDIHKNFGDNEWDTIDVYNAYIEGKYLSKWKERCPGGSEAFPYVLVHTSGNETLNFNRYILNFHTAPSIDGEPCFLFYYVSNLSKRTMTWYNAETLKAAQANDFARCIHKTLLDPLLSSTFHRYNIRIMKSTNHVGASAVCHIKVGDSGHECTTISLALYGRADDNNDTCSWIWHN